jgi:pimeloyl-ACP methyl ester carboxylesterase
MTQPTTSGHATINGLRLYYEIRGEGGTPLVLLHGGLHNTLLDAPVAARFAERRRVIAVDLQGHGRTADIDRPLSYERMADDIAALLRELAIDRADIAGYSVGAGVALRTAIQHPDRVRKLVVAAFACSADGNHPEVRAAFAHVRGAIAEMMKPSPVFQTYAAIAPHPERFPALLDKIGALISRDYDWSAEVATLATPTLLVFGDADSVSPAHAVRFFELLGGGRRDGGLDGSGMTKSRLAILPGLTHYVLFESPAFIAAVEPFLDAA